MRTEAAELSIQCLRRQTMKIHLPYGKGKLALDLPEERIAGVLCNDSMKASADATADDGAAHRFSPPA